MAVIMCTVNTYGKEIFSSIPYLTVKDRMVCEYVKLLQQHPHLIQHQRCSTPDYFIIEQKAGVGF